jgi:hypothetical protein
VCAFMYLVYMSVQVCVLPLHVCTLCCACKCVAVVHVFVIPGGQVWNSSSRFPQPKAVWSDGMWDGWVWPLLGVT